MARLASTVFVKDPDSFETVELAAGSEPEPRLAALVTNEAAWEDGKLPAAAKKAAAEQESADKDADTDGDGSTKQVTAKKAAARTPARGRKAATEGDAGSH